MIEISSVKTASGSFSRSVLYVDRSPRLDRVLKFEGLNSRRAVELFRRHFVARFWLEEIVSEIVAQREAEENQQPDNW